MPADVRAAAAAAARERNLPAGQFAIVNTRSAVDPVLTFADNRALRERVWRAFVNRGDNGNANDTNAIIARSSGSAPIAPGCSAIASHAHWRMQDTMARTPERAQELMMRVWPAAVARVREEVADQQAMARRLGQDITIEPWDYRYYMEKVRQDRYNLSQDEIKPYFELDNMIKGMFHMAGQLYGLAVHREYRPGAGLAPGHPHLAGHRPRRAATSASSTATCSRAPASARAPGRPAIAAAPACSATTSCSSSNNNNFTKPGPGEPVLISLDDAETLFHEFGHAIH